MYFHTFTCPPQRMGLPGQEYFAGTHINPRLTWWDAAGGFIDYMHRIQSVVQGAQFCGDVLYYYGDHIPVIYPYKHSDMAGCMPGFDYDVTSEDALLSLYADACGDGSRNYDDYSICKSLEGPWNVAFDPRRGGPESTVLDTLSDWTLSADEGIRYYSGPAVYSCSFDFDADTTRKTGSLPRNKLAKQSKR